jgi:rhodanese-related sulfurtransferase
VPLNAAVLLLLFGASAGTTTPRLREAEGRVVVAKGHPILVQAGSALQLVSPVPGAEIAGVGSLDELAPGDRIRYAWRSERSGVRLAERLTADAALAVDPDRAVATANLEQELQAGRVAIVDARSRREWEEGHLPGAVSLPEKSPDAALAQAPALPVVLYGASERTGDAHALARRLLAKGRTDVRTLTGGFRAWDKERREIRIEATAVARELAARRPVVVIDVRPAERAAANPLPGALSIPLGEMRPGEFSGTTRMPTIVLVGEDAADPAPAGASERIGRWRTGPNMPPWDVRVLEGGAVAYAAARLSPELRAARAPLRWDPPAEAGLVPLDEFRSRWVTNGGGAVVLDVRKLAGPRAPWVKLVPLEELASRLRELPKDRDIVVYCSAGYRSAVAAELLRRNGFRRTRHLWASPDPLP